MDYKPRRVSYKDWLEPEKLILLEGWARDGLNDEQIAHNIGIARGTLYNWKNLYSDIDDALKKGKEVIDREVENALLKRAIGYEYVETEEYIQEVDGVKTKRIKKITKYEAPNQTAQIFWLKNRKKDKYRDVWNIEVENKESKYRPLENLSDEELQEIINREANKEKEE